MYICHHFPPAMEFAQSAEFDFPQRPSSQDLPQVILDPHCPRTLGSKTHLLLGQLPGLQKVEYDIQCLSNQKLHILI